MKIFQVEKFWKKYITLVPTFETISYGMEKKSQLPVLRILGLGYREV